MLYYVWLALDQELPCTDREFPEDLCRAATRSWEDALRGSSISGMQRDVSDTLQRMGFSHDSEALVEDGMFSVDILVAGQAAVIEVDGPHHFTRNTRRPLGPTLRIDDAGAVAQAVNRLTVFVVVRADSHEAATRLFDGHPHMTIFPCDGVEVMPVLGD